MSNIDVKHHSTDYLNEYKNKKETPNWLGLLVQKVIDGNGKIDDADKDKIYHELLRENGIIIGKKTTALKSNINTVSQEKKKATSLIKKLVLHKITHIKGVNALISNQPIIFSPACTIVFGLNGTGKSGYFRIIHELAGGTKSKNILDNIHKQSNGLEVDVDYLLDNKTQDTFKWQDKTIRNIVPFNQIKVFDSEYLPMLLNERENSVNIEPLGLNLFQKIAIVIDEFKVKLSQTKQQIESQCPDLQPLIDTLHSDELKLLLEKELLSKNEKQLLDGNKAFSNENLTKLTQLRHNKISLEKNNSEDSEKVLIQQKKEIDELNNYLLMMKSALEKLTVNISYGINDFLEKKKTRDAQVKQFKVLEKIPSRNSEEWQIFIESAKEYNTQIDEHVFNTNKKCIYCHQQLDPNALMLVHAYSKFLGDQSQQNFKNTVDKIAELEAQIGVFEWSYSFSEYITKLLENINNDKKQTYKTLIDQVLIEARKQKNNLEIALKNKTTVSEKFVLDILKIKELLTKLSEREQNNLDELQQSATQKAQKIYEIEEEVNKLEDNQNITKWKIKIDNYSLIYQSIQKYAKTNQSISTRGLTDLGSKAHDELLTDTIRKCFEDELKALGKDIEVSLEKTSAGKGTIRTRLKILGNDVRNILSDGEQKVVGLALFFAEIDSQNSSCPIVLDDPVTSVDHEVADFLAQKLMKASLSRQIIIFTHNKLFYDSIVYWSSNLTDNQNNKTHHLCKNYGNNNTCKKGCHVYTYKVDRETKDRIGRVLEAQNESCQYFVEKAENEMKGNYSLSCVAGYLKSAIECYIDENVFNNQCLMKDRKRKESIKWDELKKINIDTSKIDQLKIYWDNLSDRGTHATQNQVNNPIKMEDLIIICTYLKT